MRCSRFVRIDTSFIMRHLFLFLFLLSSLVPFISNILLPVIVLFDLVYTVLNNCESLSDFVIFHVLFIIKVISEFNKIIDFSFFFIFQHFFGGGPCRFLLSFGTGLRYLRFWSAELTKIVGIKFSWFVLFWRFINLLWLLKLHFILLFESILFFLHINNFRSLLSSLFSKLFYLLGFHFIVYHGFFSFKILFHFKILKELFVLEKYAVWVFYKYKKFDYFFKYELITYFFSYCLLVGALHMDSSQLAQVD